MLPYFLIFIVFGVSFFIDRCFYMNALLYEYEQDLELLLSYLLEQEGYNLEIATDEEALLRLCRSRLPNLIVLGNDPPRQSRRDLLMRVYEVSQHFAPHILCLSTDPDFAQKSGADHRYPLAEVTCMVTPVTPKELRQYLKNVLAGSGNGVLHATGSD